MIARECYEMAAWLSRLIVAGVILATTRPALADDPNFAELLARAEAQAAAGHRWAPSGDNLTETVGAMMKLISSATPEQLAELSNLLERDARRLPHPATKSVAVSEPAASPAAAEPDPADEKPDVPPLDSDPDRPVEQPAAPATRFELDRPVERPAVSAATSEPERAITKPGALVARLPNPRATDLLARGNQAEQLGNFSGARRYYASAVQLGSATAARSLGRLYDPVFLKRTALGGIDPDLGQARHWYELAVAMGDPDAAPLSVVPSLNNLPLPAPLAAKQNADDPQNPPVPEPQHTTGVPADPSPTQAEAAISETGKPALRIYFSFESPVAAKNAQSLATRIGAELTRSDFKAESDLPKHAAIRISEERNHALARTIGQSLGDLGYEWEIENLSGLTQSRRNVIEVWLPAK